MAAVACLAVILPGGASAAKQSPKPDLSIAAGSVSVVDGKLKGSFVVADKSTARAEESTASLVVQLGKQ
jgi:hypothetical protein